ncbi:MAG: bifunctional metallophosphatase/5'-nucleotidase [Anaerolineae bacterium]|nr:bifunctional metallophosphatase/5'-nucleotidase [Anaerolineae bacterium]
MRKTWRVVPLLAVIPVVLALLLSCTASPAASDVRTLVVLYTNDEHGWMASSGDAGGAAPLMGLWQAEEGYEIGGNILLLSGGDNWTGPALSTWFEGESMVEVMNAMGYHASAIGNHEFDFGLEILRERAAQAEFPYLAANIRDKTTGDLADIAIPYVVEDINGTKVGIIGLANTGTPDITMPLYVQNLEFIAYDEALAEYVPQAKADGAELLIVVGHICGNEMRSLAREAGKLGVALIGGGHCHERITGEASGVALVEAGANLESYARVVITFDAASDTVLDVETSVKANRDGTSVLAVAEIVDKWQGELDASLSYVIGYSQRGIGRHTPEMYNLVTGAWLAAYPSADVAMSNSGGFRQSLPKGEITLADVVGVLPFDNVLIDVTVTGKQLAESLEFGRQTAASRAPAIAGLVREGDTFVFDDGSPLDPDGSYHILVNDFMYYGGDGYRFQDYDPDAYHTSIDWRQPVIDWIMALETSSEYPIEAYLDPVARY